MADSFGDFLAARYGRQWVVAARLTERLRARGYTVALSPKRYAALQREWEIETYGAPLAVLESNAANMFSTIQAIARVCADAYGQPRPAALAYTAAAMAAAAIAQVEFDGADSAHA